MKLKIVVEGKAYEVEVEYAGEAEGLEFSQPTQTTIQSSVLPSAFKLDASSDFDEAKVCRSPLAGVVIRLHAQPGQQVRPNDLLLVIDAMKMEVKIAAQSPGTVKSIEVADGDAVRPGQILVFFE
ncbi:MAG: biotin/lipoyl-containing protein [Candidatus Korobacteraceae bacterium]